MHEDSTPFPKVRNVAWDKQVQKWRVEFRVNGRKIFIGRFVDHHEAVSVANELRPKYLPRIQASMDRMAAKPKVRREPNPLPWYKRPGGRERQKQSHERLYQRRREWYRGFMTGRCCMDCGYDGSGDIPLHWHHRDPSTKRNTVASLVLVSPRNVVLAEIDKCDLVCEPCHKQRHREMSK